MTGSKSFRPLAAHGECAWSSAPVVFVLCTPGPVDGPFTSPAIAGPAPIATRASAPTPTAADFLSPTGSLLDRRSPVRADVRRLDLRATPLGCTGVDQVKKRSITAR